VEEHQNVGYPRTGVLNGLVTTGQGGPMGYRGLFGLVQAGLSKYILIHSLSILQFALFVARL